MSRIPSVPKAAGDAFVSDAAGKARTGTFPWQKQGIRADVTVQLNVRIPEPLMLAIGFLAYTSETTKRELIEIALQEWAEREAKVRGLPPWPVPRSSTRR